jgi:hypothetical protein
VKPRSIAPATAIVPALAQAQLLGTPAAFAPFSAPPPDQPDMAVDAATRAAVVESLATHVDASYVFPEVAKKVARSLRERLKKGRYEGLGQAMEFADTLNADLRALAHDLHLRVHYSNRPLPSPGTEGAQGIGGAAGPSAAERERAAAQARRLNHGFEKVERLAGNIGYIELRAFDGSPEAGAVAQAAMTLLARSDALIFDLRRNGGGDPNMIALLLSYLYSTDERVHVNDFYQREGDRTEQFWTTTTVPGPRFPSHDVYVLTSRRTGSGAEEFAYDVKQLKRGTVVGEVTAGGANPGGLVYLHPNFAAFIATGRAINPVTKTNWEGVGVEPDVKVPADEALKTAHIDALTKLIARTTDPELKAARERALAQVKNPA